VDEFRVNNLADLEDKFMRAAEVTVKPDRNRVQEKTCKQSKDFADVPAECSPAIC